MKTRTWILIIAACLLICAVATFFIFSGKNGDIAGVYLDGELIYKIDMASVTEEYELSVADGGNTITVSPEGIRVLNASCPDQTCVRHGNLRGNAPIVCLPHKLVIKWTDAENEFDAKTGV